MTNAKCESDLLISTASRRWSLGLLAGPTLVGLEVVAPPPSDSLWPCLAERGAAGVLAPEPLSDCRPDTGAAGVALPCCGGSAVAPAPFCARLRRSLPARSTRCRRLCNVVPSGEERVAQSSGALCQTLMVKTRCERLLWWFMSVLAVSRRFTPSDNAASASAGVLAGRMVASGQRKTWPWLGGSSGPQTSWISTAVVPPPGASRSRARSL
mmetsp:Transcript_37113/g.103279  ORF Transcript_37113/g.103279 Transcript_37113/m.103279 type:complete len:211 (+) Transcript_37113:2223-2855(+)